MNPLTRAASERRWSNRTEITVSAACGIFLGVLCALFI